MSKFNRFSSTGSRGFTIIEMLVVAPIVILFIGAFITVIVNMTGDVLASRGASSLAYDTQDALNRIEDDVKLSTTFLDANNINLTAPQGYANDTTNFANVDATKGDMLILNTLATNATPLSSTTGLIYLAAQPNACSSPQVNQNNPMTMNVIYFVKDSTLWRRTIAPANYTTAGCSLPYQQPSCNPAYMSANPGSSTFCKTQDIRLLDGVNPGDFTVQYFTTASATAANATASDPLALSAVRFTALQSSTTVSASLNVTKTAGGRQISQTGTIRVSKLDVNASALAATVTTSVPPAPGGVSASLSTPGQINVSWYASAPSYTLQYDTTSAFSAPTTVASGITATNRLVTGLNGAPTYYFRVRGDNSAGAGAWSSVVSQSSTITNGLVGWWRFNGNATDQSGNNYNGTVTGAGLTTGQNGVASTAYAFNGTSSQYITIPSIFGLATSSFTITTWINNPTATNSGTFMKIGLGSNGYAVGMGSTAIDNTSPGTKLVGLYEVTRWIPTTTDVGVGWHLIALTSDITGVPSIYRDGVLVGTYPGGAAVAPVTNSLIGGGNCSCSRWFNGSVDDTRVYNRALTASEISGLYSAGAQ